MIENNLMECVVCDSDDFGEHEILFLVTGQVGGPRQEIEVARCAVCGHRQKVV